MSYCLIKLLKLVKILKTTTRARDLTRRRFFQIQEKKKEGRDTLSCSSRPVAMRSDPQYHVTGLDRFRSLRDLKASNLCRMPPDMMGMPKTATLPTGSKKGLSGGI